MPVLQGPLATQNKYHVARSWERSPTEKREATKPRASQIQSTACFKCGQEGHQAAECKTGFSAKKASPTPVGKTTEAQPWARKMALKRVEVVKFTPLAKKAERTPTPTDDDQGLTDADSDDDPLVSGPVTPVTILIELSFPKSGLKANLRVLLDSGCTRCLVNPALVEKLGIQLRRLKVLIAFCQLNGSVTGGTKMHQEFRN